MPPVEHEVAGDSGCRRPCSTPIWNCQRISGAAPERRSGHLVRPAERRPCTSGRPPPAGRGRIRGEIRRRAAGTRDRAATPIGPEARPGRAPGRGPTRRRRRRTLRRATTPAPPSRARRGPGRRRARRRRRGRRPPRGRRSPAGVRVGTGDFRPEAPRRRSAEAASARTPTTRTGLSKPFSRIDLRLAVADALDPGGQVDHRLGGEDLAGRRLGAQARSDVEGGPAVAALDRHGLAGVESDPDPARQAARRRSGPAARQPPGGPGAPSGRRSAPRRRGARRASLRGRRPSRGRARRSDWPGRQRPRRRARRCSSCSPGCRR